MVATPSASLPEKVAALSLTAPATSLSVIVSTAELSGPGAAPLKLLRSRRTVSGPSTTVSFRIGMVKDLAVSPALKVSVPEVGV